MIEPPTYTVAKDLDEDGALREVIDALRADNGRLLRLLITGFISDGRPEHKQLTEVLAYHPNLRNWLGTSNAVATEERQHSDQRLPGRTAKKARHGRGRRAKRKKK
jgi:hypothetical protein